MQSEDVVRMANQIADFYGPYPHDEAVKGIAEHINKSWDPRMRRELLDLLAAGGHKSLKPLIIEAAPGFSQR